jgi:hypothetical protein
MLHEVIGIAVGNLVGDTVAELAGCTMEGWIVGVSLVGATTTGDGLLLVDDLGPWDGDTLKEGESNEGIEITDGSKLVGWRTGLDVPILDGCQLFNGLSI